jgi:DNA-binding transcriptional ArsR family regulator
VLKEAGLVTDRRDGARRIYAIDLSGLAELRDYLDRFWGLGLARYKAAAERKEVSPDG